MSFTSWFVIDLNILGCYVGHTTDFTRRKQCHKSKCDNENGSKYNTKFIQLFVRMEAGLIGLWSK
jgi:predicted GIY-YIG superfamily endonuclease